VIRAVGVVVPAHDEEALLPSCLRALATAATRVRPLPVHVVVVADSCADGTAARAQEAGARVLEVDARNVGTARDTGMRAVLGAACHLDPADVWLATTDADSQVPPGWLAQQISQADRGWDVVVGTVTVTDWSEHPPEAGPLFLAQYTTSGPVHPHVHGANLGFSGRAYLAAGGFGAIRTAEDHALVRALEHSGSTILRTTEVSVVTSARRRARAPAGFSALVTGLYAHQDRARPVV
jgi:glycosyltransferase involved in cell wall biosynthesis